MFGERLKQLRLEKNIFQEDLADLLGVSVQAYSNYERNERQPDFNTLIKLADYFNVSIDYLLGRTDLKDALTNEELELKLTILKKLDDAGIQISLKNDK